MEERIETLFTRIYPEMTGETQTDPELPGGVEVQDELSLLPGMRLEEAVYQARVTLAMKYGASTEDGALLQLVERYETLMAYLCRESFRYGYKIGMADGQMRSQ